MDYKKEYEAMVQRARELHEAGNDLTKRQMEIVCPELAESEDERIRKKLVQFFSDIKSISESGRTEWAVRKEDAKLCKAAIAYLEKHKEPVVSKKGIYCYDGERFILLREVL